MDRTYKVPVSTYFGLGLFAAGLAFVCLLAPCIFAYPSCPFSQVLLLLSLAVAIPVAVVCWLSRFRITITSSALTYASLHCGARTINLSDIKSSGVILRGGTRGLQPLLEVRTPTVILRINYKVFSQEARKDLFQVVAANPVVGSF
jgi:hypothetical protein